MGLVLQRMSQSSVVDTRVASSSAPPLTWRVLLSYGETRSLVGGSLAQGDA